VFLVAFLVFVVWPLLELFVIVQVAEAIGVLLTIALLIAAVPFGSWAMRSEGRAVWRRFNAAIAEGRPPGREVVDGALVVLGGGLLIVPGFITDIFGLLLLFPLTRVPVRATLMRNLQNRLVVQAGRFARRSGGTGVHDDADAYDVEGTATEVDPPKLQP
jgi:UPF0716 protein FxsA